MASVDEVKNNIRRLVEAGAPREKVSAYVAAEGYAPEQLRGQASPSTKQEPEFSARDALRSTFQGATFQHGDEIAGGIGAGIAKIMGDEKPFSDIYRDITDAERKEQDRFSQDFPVADFALQAAGGLATGLSGPVRQGAAKAGQLASRLVRTPGARQTATQAALAGAGGGAVAGVGAAENVGDIPGQAAIGGTVGAVAGPAIQGALNTPAYVGRRIAERFGKDGAHTAGLRQLGQAFKQDEIPVEEIPARLQRMGDPAIVGDTGGKNVEKLLRTARGAPGKSANRVDSFLEARQKSAPSRIVEEVFRQSPEDFFEALDTLVATRKAAAEPLYAVAHSQPNLRLTPQLRKLLKRPSLKNAFHDANRNILEEGQSLGGRKRAPTDSLSQLGNQDFMNPEIAIEPGLLKDFRKGVDGLASMRWQTVDYVDRALNSRIRKLTEMGELEDAGRLMGTLREFRSLTEPKNPTLRVARNEWAGSRQMEEAMNFGNKFLEGSDFVLKIRQFKTMSDSEKEMVKIGVARNIQRMVEGVGKKTEDKSRRLLDGIGIENRLKEVFEPEEFRAIMKRLETEDKFNRVKNTAVGGSQTADKQQSNKFLGLDPSALIDLGLGRPGQAIAGTARNVADFITAAPPGIRDELGQLLLEQSPAGARRMVDAINRPPRFPVRPVGNNRDLVNALTFGGTTASQDR